MYDEQQACFSAVLTCKVHPNSKLQIFSKSRENITFPFNILGYTPERTLPKKKKKLLHKNFLDTKQVKRNFSIH